MQNPKKSVVFLLFFCSTPWSGGSIWVCLSFLMHSHRESPENPLLYQWNMLFLILVSFEWYWPKLLKSERKIQTLHWSSEIFEQNIFWKFSNEIINFSVFELSSNWHKVICAEDRTKEKNLDLDFLYYYIACAANWVNVLFPN